MKAIYEFFKTDIKDYIFEILTIFAISLFTILIGLMFVASFLI